MPFRPVLILCFLPVLSALTEPAKAQTRTDTLKVSLDPIEVKATHSAISAEKPPFSLSLLSLSAEELTHSASVTLDEMISLMPGIWINNRENYALGERITVRGIGWRAQFGVRGIQVVLDGIPLTMADGQAVLNVVDPVFIHRVELIRGPSSMFWGNSSGGVLYLSTAPANPASSSYQIRGTAGSYGLKKGDIQFSQLVGDHKVNGYLSYLEETGYRDHSEVRLARAGVTGSIGLNSNSRIEYFGAYASMPEAEHPSSLTRQQMLENPAQANSSFESLDAGKHTAQGQLGASFTHNNALGFLTATLYGNFRQLDNPLPFAIIDLERRAAGGRITLQNSFGPLGFNFGMESKIQRDLRKEFENEAGQRGAVSVDQLEKVYSNALFLTGTFTKESLQIMGSVRYDWIRFDADATDPSQSGRRDFQSVSPGLGITYSLNDVDFFGNVSTAFEVPTTTELVNRPGGGNGFNPDIGPERTLGVEIGSRGQLSSPTLHFDLALYQLWIQDLLLPYQLEANGATYFRNQGKTRHRGFEAAVQYDISSTIQTGLTYNLTGAGFIQAQTLDSVSLKENRVPGIPEHRFSGILHWKPGNWWITAEAQYVSGFPVDNLNSAKTDDYFVVNGRFSYAPIPLSPNVHLTPFLAVNNIFDTLYSGSVVVNAFGGRYYEPAAGANWKSGISMQFK